MTGFLHILSLVAVTAFAGLLIHAAIHDCRHYLITNRTVIAVVAILAVFLLAQAALPPDMRVITHPFAHFWKAAILALVVFAGATGLFVAGVMGGGDVKLLAAATLWAGTEWTAAFLLTTAVAGGLVSLAVLTGAKIRAIRAERMADSGQTSLIVNSLEPKMSQLKVPYGLGISVGGLVVAYALMSRMGGFS